MLLLIPAAYFLYRRSVTLLHVFQQHEYDGVRFVQWIFSSKSFDSHISLALGALFVLAAGLGLDALYVAIAAAIIVFLLAFIEDDPVRTGKKPLVLTNRAKRILWVECACAIIVLVSGACALLIIQPGSVAALLLYMIVVTQALPLFFPLSNLVLSPVENGIQTKILDKAKAKLHACNPVVIGITGSYGKTSTKSILYHILSSCASSLATPGSVNTTMGISRVILETLSDRHAYFIVEMGAYGPGSIDSLCELVAPNAGIITRIGTAHFERFKQIDVTIRAKLELGDSVLERDGSMVVFDSSELFLSEAKRRLAGDHVFVVKDEHASGIDVGHPVLIDGESIDENGLRFTLHYQGRAIDIAAPVYGRHQAENIALAVTLSLSLGFDEANILAALQSLPQVAHRMEVKKSRLSPTLIDDAYNSNPEGFISALETLGRLKQSGKAVLLTPGMVELGAMHEQEHQRVGKFGGPILDLVLLVQPDRITSFVEGLRSGGYMGDIHEFDSFDAAWAWAKEHLEANDVILIENDLPDIYEKTLRI